MSAYNRGELSLEAYLVRILAAMCRQSGGEIRIKGELVDAINEPTTLLKDWDSRTQELVLRTHLGTFGEVFRVTPEKPPTRSGSKRKPRNHCLFHFKAHRRSMMENWRTSKKCWTKGGLRVNSP